MQLFTLIITISAGYLTQCCNLVDLEGLRISVLSRQNLRTTTTYQILQPYVSADYLTKVWGLLALV